MNPFTYSYPVKVYFGEKAAEKNLSVELSKVGPNVMLAYGGGSIKKNGVYDGLMRILKDAGKIVTEFTGIMSNPTYAKVQEGAALAKEKNIDFILAVGDGSVIDCCKIVSAQATLDQDIWELEYSNHKQPTDFISIGAVVTAFGTGAEMNNGAVITNEEKMLKSALWGVSAYGKSEAELAEAFVDTLEAFIKEIGLPTTFTEMGIPEETDYKAIADSTVLTGGCAKKFTKTELMEVLLECR